MPVDIRSFFSKAPASSKKKDSNASASISSNNKTSKVENKPKVAALASATKVAAAKSATKIAPGPSQKKQVVNVEEEKPKEKEKPKENKRKVIIESSDDDEPMEVSAKDFYQMASAKKAALKSPPKKSRPTVARLEEEEDSELEPSPSPVRKSPRKKVISVKKPVIQSCNDDSSSQDAEDEKPKAKRKLPPKKSVTTPKKARQEKLTPLAPGLELDEFNTDNLQVPECLQGRTFVLTGVLDNLHRDDAMDLIKTMGGRVTTAVSGKTDYLVVGAILEDGRSYTEGSKYKKALQLDSAQICMGEKQLYGLCHLYHAQAMKEKGIEAKPKPVEKKLAPTTTTTAKPPPAAAAAAAAKAPSAAAPANPYAKTAASVSNPYAKKPGTAAAGNPYAKSAASNPYAKSNNPYANKSSAAAAPIKSDFDRNSLWVDKHAPQRTDEILGNKDNVTKVQQWLQSWERTFNNSKSYGKAFSNPKGPWKAALMSGPPGIGSKFKWPYCALMFGMNTTYTLTHVVLTNALFPFHYRNHHCYIGGQRSWPRLVGIQCL
jgi:replication factor C subunit 1